MKLGVILNLNAESDISEKICRLHDMGFSHCQISCWNSDCYTDENAERIRTACEKYGITVSTFWTGWSGKGVWDLYNGPLTLGLVPTATRWIRMQDIMKGSDFAKKLGVDQIATHAGFIPEDPNNPTYREVVCALREVAEHAKKNGQYFLFETGQETPATLKRTIDDIGLDNLGINLDPANLISYGKANPVDALDTIGEYVRDVHAKDAVYPKNGFHTGGEVKFGQGKVDFPALLARLRSLGYDKTLIIEREISGEQQLIDIAEMKVYLEELLQSNS